MCQNCGKKRSDGHHLLNCGGCNNAHCCSKECQDQSWRDGHKQVCKQYQAAKAAQSEGEHAEAFAAYAEWSNKTKRMLISAATSALWVPTLRLATHALVLLLDYLPSLPLKFQVRGFQVVSKAVLEVDLGLSLELPRINRPGTDRRALVLIMMSVPDMVRMVPCGISETTASLVQSGSLQMRATADYIRDLNDPEIQRRMQNNQLFSTW